MKNVPDFFCSSKMILTPEKTSEKCHRHPFTTIFRGFCQFFIDFGGLPYVKGWSQHIPLGRPQGVQPMEKDALQHLHA